ncbi:MFS transporter [Pseudomonas sp. GL-RE-19]|uniref:MFS transporter n=1 Tax=Pseudomonas sp. GL-RE-19 TaxID=2832389 RepID=UPI001CC111D2|nr:MFS transporter [Pseudomonas sp. GL-RE-19]
MQGERHAGMPQSVLLLLGSCLPVLGAVLLAPVLPRMQLHFTETPGATVLVPVALTLPALMVAVLAPFAGIFADRVGRKPLLLWAMLMYMVCGTVPLWLDSLQAIVLSRAGIGLAEAAIMTCCTTLIGDYYSGGRRERLFALQMVATSLSAALFMAVGGQMGQDSWRAPFALYSVGLVFLPLMAWWLWEPQRTLSTRTDDKHLPWRGLLPLLGLSLLAGMSLFIVPVQAGYLLNLLGVDGPQQIGMTMGGNQLGVVVGAFSFRLVGRTRPSWLLLLAFALAGSGGLMMAAADTHAMVSLAVFINGLGIGLMLPTLITRIMAQVDFSQRGRASGLLTSAIFAGEFVSPLVVLAMTAGVSSALPTALAVIGALQWLVALGCLRLLGTAPLGEHA